MFSSPLFCYLKLEGASRQIIFNVDANTLKLKQWVRRCTSQSLLHFKGFAPSAMLTQHKSVTTLIPSHCAECVRLLRWVFEVPCWPKTLGSDPSQPQPIKHSHKHIQDTHKHALSQQGSIYKDEHVCVRTSAGTLKDSGNTFSHACTCILFNSASGSTPESIWFTFCGASLFMVNWKAAHSDIRPGIKVHISWIENGNSVVK